MIDWVSCLIPIYHRKPLSCGLVASLNDSGDVEWQTLKRLSVEGSYSSTVSIRSCEHTNTASLGYQFIEISGNPTKFFQGHNAFGSNDLHGLVLEFVSVLIQRFSISHGFAISRQQYDLLVNGHIQLTRVDMNEMFDCGSQKGVTDWIYAAERSARTRTGKGLLQGQTLKFAAKSEYWNLTIYNKWLEMQAKGHTPHPDIASTKLMDWVKPLLRVEFRLRSKQLKHMGLNLISNWDDSTYNDVYQELLRKIQMSDNHSIQDNVLDLIPSRLVGIYGLWKSGADMKTRLPKNTFYRNRRELLKFGIDIAIRQAIDAPDRSNVVPLIRYIEATPVQAPDWAIGTNLFFQPRKSFF